MAKNEPKTRQNDASVAGFLNAIEPAARRADAKALDKLMRKITGEKPKMWGTSIVGYGAYHYKYASGRQGDAMRVGFSPRKQNLTVYIMPGFSEYRGLLERLGKHTTGKSCLYIKRLSDIDLNVLEAMIGKSVAAMNARHPPG